MPSWIRQLPRSRPARWTLAAVVVMAVLGAAASLWPTGATRAEPAMMRYSEFLAAIRASRVDSIQLQQGQPLRAWLHTAMDAAAREVSVEHGPEQAGAIVAAATDARVGVAFVPRARDRSQAITLAVTLAIAAGLGVLLYLQHGRQPSGMSGTIDTSSPGELTDRTTFADVAGNAAAIADLREVVEFLRDPKRFVRLGARVPKGILLEGPPGTGKTLMARALAGEANTDFFAVSGPDFSGMFVGLGTMRVKNLFRKARRSGGGVIFIDEIDSLGGRRGRVNGHPEDDRTLNQFLVELDGFGAASGIIVVGATNRAADLDPALLRKGRFDRSVTIGLPTVTERAQILSLHAAKRQMPLAHDVELKRLARLMPGASGADLEGLLNEAALLAVRTGSSAVAWAHMEEARDRVLLGRAREGFVITPHERRLVALHEAGHAIAGVVFCPNDPLHKVTVEPRGVAMGVAFFQPDHELHLHSRAYLEGQLRKSFGGRAAEELVYGTESITSGASNDLQQATRIAKQMVYKLGMGSSTGLMVFDPDSGPVSADLHARMDEDTRRILDLAYRDTLALLRQNRGALEALAAALVEHETLSGAVALGILEDAGLARPLPADTTLN